MTMRRLSLAVVALVLCSVSAYAQSPPAFAPARGRTYAGTSARPLSGPSTAAPEDVVTAFLRARGIDVAGALVQTRQAAIAGGLTSIRFDQQSGGLRVYGVSAKAAFSSRGELVHLTENVAAGDGAAGAPRASAARALAAALAHLHPDAGAPPAETRREGAKTVFARTAFFHAEPAVTRVVYPGDDGRLHAGLVAETWSDRGNYLHETLVGADGEIVAVASRTSSDSYNVFIEDPSKGPQTTVSGPAPGGILSPAGWLNTSVSQSTINITGNNVHAYLDAKPENRPDRGGSSIFDGQFLTAVDLAQEPSITANRAVSVQNLFFQNNLVHDLLYAAGFDEAAGNFQTDNFGRGGAGGDAVNAESQDGSGTDNANFATPPEGTSPRMQVFLWTGAGPTHQVVINSPSPATYGAMGATFGKALNANGITGDVVLVNDGVDPASDGCEPTAQTGLRGKILLVDRGTCTFVLKAQNAQRAGAAAIIVANNTGGTEIIPMGGDANLRIAAVLISQNDGAALKALSNPNATARAHPNPPLSIDASLDADIIYHEFGHGLTWRMIGGMSGPMAGAIGEGMSDVVAFLLNGDDRIAEYSASSALGIRRDPYTAYPRTYGDVDGGEVHDDGEVYAAIIWRLKEIFNTAGESDSALLGLLVNGMNFTPSTPAFEDMRDGIVQAADAAGGAHTCKVWEAFAQFGVGPNASGTTASPIVIVEDFSLPASCTP